MTFTEAQARLAEIEGLLLLPEETSVSAGGVSQQAKRSHEALQKERDQLLVSIRRAQRGGRATRGVYVWC